MVVSVTVLVYGVLPVFWRRIPAWRVFSGWHYLPEKLAVITDHFRQKQNMGARRNFSPPSFSCPVLSCLWGSKTAIDHITWSFNFPKLFGISNQRTHESITGQLTCSTKRCCYSGDLMLSFKTRSILCWRKDTKLYVGCSFVWKDLVCSMLQSKDETLAGADQMNHAACLRDKMSEKTIVCVWPTQLHCGDEQILFGNVGCVISEILMIDSPEKKKLVWWRITHANVLLRAQSLTRCHPQSRWIGSENGKYN